MDINLGSMIIQFDGNKMTVAFYHKSDFSILTKQNAKDLIKELKKITKDKK